MHQKRIYLNRGSDVLVLNGIFQDNICIPDHTVSVANGTRAVISIREPIQRTSQKTLEQKKAWDDFFEGIRGLDEELPAEFDAIIERGIAFNQADFS